MEILIKAIISSDGMEPDEAPFKILNAVKFGLSSNGIKFEDSKIGAHIVKPGCGCACKDR